ncbi:DUF4199 domain-containing protein [Hymenobacter coccineus]|uniref:DUF4199 domain-containing protein n=1 Tax=Hymenobacter coccineus TaxID=1908235 RepID=A0A1G1TIJ2_9BACT|nr:DUF4199 domain-containing protein [Hymenobacter coccineus]OGX90683.1 hypothetical protein BEN49_22050 [Hymenobacter coccineus]
METSTAAPVTTTSAGLRYGLLTGLVSIIFTFILLATGQEGNGGLASIAFVILIVGIVLAHRAFKSANKGYMSYGQGLGIGVLVGGINGILTTVFNYVYRAFIDPDMAARTMDQMRAKLEAAGSMSEAQIEQVVNTSMKYSTGAIGLAIGIVGGFFVGLVFSLVIAAITKNAKPEFE